MKKKNTVLIVLIIILFLMVVGLGGFIVYDKVDNTQLSDNNNIENNHSNSQDNNSNESINKDSVQVDYSKLTDMGTGINVKSIDGYNYQLSVDSKGEISYLNKENGTKGNINVKNVVDVVFQQYAGEENGEYFILTNEGQLYTITEKNIISNNFEPIKDVVLGKVLKIGTFSTCKPDAGCGWGVYCITADGNTKQLVFTSV